MDITIYYIPYVDLDNGINSPEFIGFTWESLGDLMGSENGIPETWQF